MCAKTYSIQVTQNLPGAAGRSVTGTFGKLVGATICSKSSSNPSCSNSSSSFKSSSWANKIRIKLFRTEIAILSAHHRPTIIITEFFILDIRLISRTKISKRVKKQQWRCLSEHLAKIHHNVAVCAYFRDIVQTMKKKTDFVQDFANTWNLGSFLWKFNADLWLMSHRVIGWSRLM